MDPDKTPSDPQEFASLKKLLAWKRHEQPPQGYFDGFAAKVRARIAAEASAPKPTLWQRWSESLRLNPLATGATALAGVAAVVLVANVALRSDTPTRPGDSTKAPAAKQPAPAEVASQPSASQPAIASTGSTNAVSNTAPAGLFEPLQQGVQPAALRSTNP
jgi:negative regulator of sigma E activity